MPSTIPQAIVRLLGLSIAFAPPSHAHGGHGSETEARIYPDRMRVVLRTSVQQAWQLLGDRAPATGSEADTATALSLLAGKAPDLIEVTAANGVMTPRSSDCMMEPDQHVAFVLKFDRPPDGGLRLDARFTRHFDALEAGTVAVFDHTASPFRRDIAPLASGEFSRSQATFSCSIGTPTATSAPEPEEATAESGPPPARPLPMVRPLAALALAALVIAWRKSTANPCG